MTALRPAPPSARRARRVRATRRLGIALGVLGTLGATPPADVPRVDARDVPRHGLLHVPGCDPARCTLERPTADERAALLADADGLVARWRDDSTALGRHCAALGHLMRAAVDDVRMLPVMWRAPDPDGYLAAVTGDAHRREPAAGAGRVHIARGYDALNPDRGRDAVLQTARHEFAHLLGMEGRERWGVDEGAELAVTCAAPPR